MGLLLGIAAVLEVFGHVPGLDVVNFCEVKGALDGEEEVPFPPTGLIPPFVPFLFQVADLCPKFAVLFAQVAQGFLQVAGEDFLALDALVGELGLQEGRLGLVAVPLAVEGQAGALEGVCGGL